MWTSHGGLRKHITGLFGTDATSTDLKHQVGHMGDLFYYYAIIATFLFVVVSLLKALQVRLVPKLEKVLPNMQDIKELLLDETHSLIIFMGIYVYLIYNSGSIFYII